MLQDRIKKARKVTQIDVPAWGGPVWIRSLSVGEHLELESALAASKDNHDAKNELVLKALLFAVCDEKQEPAFDSLDSVRSAPADGFPVVTDAVMKHLGFSGEPPAKNS